MIITCGVPQGSILGPLFFILYINDIENVSDILNHILFADDTSLFHAHTCFNTLTEEVNIEIQKTSTWFHTNKLSINTKSQILLYSHQKEKIQYQQCLNTSRWKQNKACQIHQIPRDISR